MDLIVRAAPTLLLAVALLTPAFALAQGSPPPPANAPTEALVEEIEVTGHYQNAVGTSDAASAGVITRQLIGAAPSCARARCWNWCRA